MEARAFKTDLLSPVTLGRAGGADTVIIDGVKIVEGATRGGAKVAVLGGN